MTVRAVVSVPLDLRRVCTSIGRGAQVLRSGIVRRALAAPFCLLFSDGARGKSLETTSGQSQCAAAATRRHMLK